MIPYIISQNGTINATVNGRSYSFDSSSKVYANIKEAINNQDIPAFLKWVDFDNGFRSRSQGKVTFQDGSIRYNGALVDNSLSRRIFQLYTEGFNFQPLIKFLENCYENPNPTVVERLYDFLENNCIMIDTDGYVVGYRKVDLEGWDYWSGTVQYKVGEVVEKPRAECDESSINTCSKGLHLGSLDYVTNQWQPGRGKVLICRTHPKDVTAIPEEAGAPKLRSCRLEVLAEYHGEEPTAVYGYVQEDEEEECCNFCCGCGDDGVNYDSEEPILELRDASGRILAGVCDTPESEFICAGKPSYGQNMVKDTYGLQPKSTLKRGPDGRFVK